MHASAYLFSPTSPKGVKAYTEQRPGDSKRQTRALCPPHTCAAQRRQLLWAPHTPHTVALAPVLRPPPPPPSTGRYGTAHASGGCLCQYGRLRGFTRASDAAPPQRAQHSTFCRSLSLETVVRASTNYSCTRTLNPLHRTRTVLVLCLRNCVHSIPPYCEHSTQCAQS